MNKEKRTDECSARILFPLLNLTCTHVFWELAFSIPWVIFQNRVLHFIPEIFCSSLLILPPHNSFYCSQCSETYLPLSYVLLGYTSIALYIIVNVFLSWPPLDFTEHISSWEYTVCVYIHYMLTFSCRHVRHRVFLKLCL